MKLDCIRVKQIHQLNYNVAIIFMDDSMLFERQEKLLHLRPTTSNCSEYLSVSKLVFPTATALWPSKCVSCIAII